MEKYAFIQEHEILFSVRMMCRHLAVSSSGYYGWLKRSPSRRSLEDESIKLKVLEVFRAHRSRYGAIRIWKEFHAQGLVYGRDRIARLMRDMGLRAKATRAKRVQTTTRDESNPVHENLLKRKFHGHQPGRIWVSDITYIRTKGGFLYLSGTMDLGSRYLAGWSIQDDLGSEGPLEALHMAMKHRKPKPGAIHHSDRGAQYTSHAFQNALRHAGMRCSMSAKGQCWDNAPMESFWGRMKEELEARVFESKEEARKRIFEYIEVYYNRQRRHSALGYLTPQEFELQKVA